MLQNNNNNKNNNNSTNNMRRDLTAFKRTEHRNSRIATLLSLYCFPMAETSNPNRLRSLIENPDQCSEMKNEWFAVHYSHHENSTGCHIPFIKLSQKYTQQGLLFSLVPVIMKRPALNRFLNHLSLTKFGQNKFETDNTSCAYNTLQQQILSESNQPYRFDEGGFLK
uniref:Uncharacterized protein n=1 Tax=Glossina pallidipes TaxID=7398 RepID=A0A1A9ZNC4_GLOPL